MRNVFKQIRRLAAIAIGSWLLYLSAFVEYSSQKPETRSNGLCKLSVSLITKHLHGDCTTTVCVQYLDVRIFMKEDLSCEIKFPSLPFQALELSSSRQMNTVSILCKQFSISMLHCKPGLIFSTSTLLWHSDLYHVAGFTSSSPFPESSNWKMLLDRAEAWEWSPFSSHSADRWRLIARPFKVITRQGREVSPCF